MGATWASVDLLSQLSALSGKTITDTLSKMPECTFLYDAVASPKKERAPG